MNGTAAPALIPTDPQTHCSNDHGISPDGQSLAISDATGSDGKSTVFILPIAGGTPRQITENRPSYWHGWSPNGKTEIFGDQRTINVPSWSPDSRKLAFVSYALRP